MAADSTPPAEVEVDAALVRELLAGQHPDLAGLELVRVGSGWDNEIYRLGDDLAVRLPRRRMAAVLVEHEQRWLPGLAGRLPLAVPAPVRIGFPGAGFPWRWSVTLWVPGEVAGTSGLDDPEAAAADVGAFLAALHEPAPSEAPSNPYRGVALVHRDPSVRERVGMIDREIDTYAVLDCWAAALEVPPWSGPRVWLHGDLHPLNLVVSGGRVSGVIDWGDVTAGDPATDLAVAWMLLPPPARSVLRHHAGDVDDDTWDRARGWALALSLAMLAHSADAPDLAAVGRRTLDAVLADG